MLSKWVQVAFISFYTCVMFPSVGLQGQILFLFPGVSNNEKILQSKDYIVGFELGQQLRSAESIDTNGKTRR